MNSIRRAFLVMTVAATASVYAAEGDVRFAEGTWVLNVAQTEFGAGPFRSRSETLRIEKSSNADFALRVDGEDWSGNRYLEVWRGAPDGALEDAEGNAHLRASFEWDGRDLLIIEKFADVTARIRAHFSDDGRKMSAAYLNRNGDAIATWVYKKQ